MNWSTRLRVLSHEFYIGVKKYTYVTGVNSKMEDGNHFLMWDFDADRDDKDAYTQVYANLLEAQLNNHLGDIHLLDTGRGIHAYCLMSLPWREAFRVVENTLGVDPTYLKMAYVRGYFTLRFTEKSGRRKKISYPLKNACLV